MKIENVSVQIVIAKKPSVPKICPCGRCEFSTSRKEYKLEVERIANLANSVKEIRSLVRASDWTRCANKIALARVVSSGYNTPMQKRMIQGIAGLRPLVRFSEVKRETERLMVEDVRQAFATRVNSQVPKRQRTKANVTA